MPPFLLLARPHFADCTVNIVCHLVIFQIPHKPLQELITTSIGKNVRDDILENIVIILLIALYSFGTGGLIKRIFAIIQVRMVIQTLRKEIMLHSFRNIFSCSFFYSYSSKFLLRSDADKVPAGIASLNMESVRIKVDAHRRFPP